MPWRCEKCGLQFEEEPQVCSDCLNETFEEVGGREPATQKTESDPPKDSFPSPGLRRREIAGGVVIVLALIVGVWWVATGGIALGPEHCAGILDSDPASDTIDRSFAECEIHQTVNEERDQRGLATLSFHTGRQSAARDMAETMAQRELSPDAAGSSLDKDQMLAEHNAECTTDRSNYWFIYHETQYQRPMSREDGTTARYDSNSELAEGVVQRSLEDQDTREIVFDTGYSDHAVGSYVTSSNTVYAVEIYC